MPPALRPHWPIVPEERPIGLKLGFSVMINSYEVSDKMLPSSASLGWEAGDKTRGTF